MDEPVTGSFVLWGLRLPGNTLLAQRPAGVDEPLLPRLRGLRFLAGVDQQLPACRAAVILSFEKLQGEATQWWGFALAPSVSPVPGQDGVVRGRPCSDQDMANDLGPGGFAEVGARLRVTEPP